MRCPSWMRSTLSSFVSMFFEVSSKVFVPEDRLEEPGRTEVICDPFSYVLRSPKDPLTVPLRKSTTVSPTPTCFLVPSEGYDIEKSIFSVTLTPATTFTRSSSLSAIECSSEIVSAPCISAGIAGIPCAMHYLLYQPYRAPTAPWLPAAIARRNQMGTAWAPKKKGG